MLDVYEQMMLNLRRMRERETLHEELKRVTYADMCPRCGAHLGKKNVKECLSCGWEREEDSE